MKKQDKFLTLSIRFNGEDREVLRKLKDDYGFNISGLIKITLREKLRQMEKTENEKPQ
jgi:hypothetical protein